jgi:translation initiation factor IF-2
MEKKIKTRPPIVTVLGHVNHGKTTLLDAIRKTRIAFKEAGGITQNIGASQVTTKEGKKITFIDTPGHAAFSQMRSRGARVADIAILVIAADDGVKPQTKESIVQINEAKIPFIVAITKVDLATANVEAVLGQLEKEGILLEKRGGNTPWIELSAKTGKGIGALLELISLMAEMNAIKGDPEDSLEAVVIETSKDKGGPVVNAVIRNGQIMVGQNLYTETGQTKVRCLISSKGMTKVALPGDAVQILGFEILPEVGAKIFSTVMDKAQTKNLEKEHRKIEEGQVGLLIKAKNSGCLEAILANMPSEVFVVDSGVGDVYESDVLLAKASGVSRIFAFESKAPSAVRKLAEAEGVNIKTFKVIYELFQEIDDIIKKGKTEILGKAEIIALFPFNDKKIAGCRVVSGKINKSDNLVLMRKDMELGKIKAISLQKQKQIINQAGQGEEFGILFEPQFDFVKGDMVVSVAK